MVRDSLGCLSPKSTSQFVKEGKSENQDKQGIGQRMLTSSSVLGGKQAHVTDTRRSPTVRAAGGHRARWGWKTLRGCVWRSQAPRGRHGAGSTSWGSASLPGDTRLCGHTAVTPRRRQGSALRRTANSGRVQPSRRSAARNGIREQAAGKRGGPGSGPHVRDRDLSNQRHCGHIFNQ